MCQSADRQGERRSEGRSKGNVMASKIKIFFSYEQNLFCV